MSFDKMPLAKQGHYNVKGGVFLDYNYYFVWIIRELLMLNK